MVVSGLMGGSTSLPWLQAIELADVIGRGKWAIECFDDDHAATAAWARWRFVVGGGRADVIAVGVRGSRRWHIESPSTEFELVGAMAVGEQAVVTDAMEAAPQNVDQEATDDSRLSSVIILKRSRPSIR